jgi:lysophospholipase L1-like esterase
VASDSRRYFGPSGRVDYRINQLRFRGEEISVEKPPGVRRILCLGDSFTFGEGVREEDAWPQRLGRLAGPGTQVINAGVQGYSLDDEATHLFLYGRKLMPDVVVIGFFMNDAMTFEATVSGETNMTEATELSPLSRLSALWRLRERRRSDARRTSLYLTDLRTSFSDQRWRDTRARLRNLRTLADHDGFRIVAMIFPLLHQLQEYPLEPEREEVRKGFVDAGIAVVDLLDSYRAYKAPDLWVHVVDPHPNEIAHAMAAERIAQSLQIAR